MRGKCTAEAASGKSSYVLDSMSLCIETHLVEAWGTWLDQDASIQLTSLSLSLELSLPAAASAQTSSQGCGILLDAPMTILRHAQHGQKLATAAKSPWLGHQTTATSMSRKSSRSMCLGVIPWKIRSSQCPACSVVLARRTGCLTPHRVLTILGVVLVCAHILHIHTCARPRA